MKAIRIPLQRKYALFKQENPDFLSHLLDNMECFREAYQTLPAIGDVNPRGWKGGVESYLTREGYSLDKDFICAGPLCGLIDWDADKKRRDTAKAGLRNALINAECISHDCTTLFDPDRDVLYLAKRKEAQVPGPTDVVAHKKQASPLLTRRANLPRGFSQTQIDQIRDVVREAVSDASTVLAAPVPATPYGSHDVKRQLSKWLLQDAHCELSSRGVDSGSAILMPSRPNSGKDEICEYRDVFGNGRIICLERDAAIAAEIQKSYPKANVLRGDAGTIMAVMGDQVDDVIFAHFDFQGNFAKENIQCIDGIFAHSGNALYLRISNLNHNRDTRSSDELADSYYSGPVADLLLSLVEAYGEEIDLKLWEDNRHNPAVLNLLVATLKGADHGYVIDSSPKIVVHRSKGGRTGDMITCAATFVKMEDIGYGLVNAIFEMQNSIRMQYSHS